MHQMWNGLLDTMDSSGPLLQDSKHFLRGPFWTCPDILQMEGPKL